MLYTEYLLNVIKEHCLVNLFCNIINVSKCINVSLFSKIIRFRLLLVFSLERYKLYNKKIIDIILLFIRNSLY